MSTITKEFTKEQLQQIEAAAKEVMWPVVWSEKKAREHFSEKITPKVVLKLARIALASLEAEPVGYMNRFTGRVFTLEEQPGADTDFQVYVPVYTALPAPVSVPDESAVELLATDLMKRIDKITGERHSVAKLSALRVSIVEACRAAMLQGAEPVSNRDELPDDFDFDRFNDVVWLEAVASNPHMHSPTTSTIAMVALELNKKLADGKPELTVWYGSMPESNGKANWTAILHRKGEGRCMDGFTIDRSEYPGRVLYAADRVRYLIGEKSERPSILDYDADAHSGYVKPGNSPVIPDCWCRTCRPITLRDMRFVVCPECGNKRCPHANDHRNACTGSNEPGQEGSAYPAAPQQEVK